MLRSAASSSKSSRTVVGIAELRLHMRSMMTASSSPNPRIRTTDLLVTSKPLGLVTRVEAATDRHPLSQHLRTKIVDHDGGTREPTVGAQRRADPPSVAAS